MTTEHADYDERWPTELHGRSLDWLIAEWNLLAERIGDKPYNGTGFGDLGYEIAHHGQAAAPFLLDRIGSSHPAKRAAAVDFLPFTGPDAIDHLDAILACLADPADVVRASAIDALHHLRRAELTETIRAFLDDPDWLVQNAALSFLIWADPEFGVAEAITRLRDPRPRVRSRSIDLIDELTDEDASDAAWEVILPLIGDRDQGVRAAARWYLTNRLERVLPERAHLPTSPAEWIRAVHAASLAAIDPNAALRVHARDESRIVRLALVEELANIANEPALRKARAACRVQIELLLRDPDNRVREATLDIASF